MLLQVVKALKNTSRNDSRRLMKAIAHGYFMVTEPVIALEECGISNRDLPEHGSRVIGV